MLYRAVGEPNITSNIPFKDIKLGSYYESAVRWGYRCRVANGITETQCSPNTTGTRAQAVTLLERCNGSVKDHIEKLQKNN